MKGQKIGKGMERKEREEKNRSEKARKGNGKRQ